MSYKLLVTDFDGTLFSWKNGGIHKENLDAIATARASGKYVVVCTGRSWKSMTKFEKELGCDINGSFGIAFNGGAVYTQTNGEKEFLYSKTMTATFAHELIKKLKNIKSPELEIYVYDDKGDLYAEEHLRGKNVLGEDGNLRLGFVDDFESITCGFSKVLLLGDFEKLKNAAGLTSEYFSVFSGHDLLEFLPPDVNKGNGVAFLANHLNIKSEEIITIGDAGNDTAMLKYAGLGVAVKNATEEAKAAADLVLDKTCNDSAVAYVINTYLI